MKRVAVVADSQRGGFEQKIVDAIRSVDAVVFLGGAPRSFDASFDEQCEDLECTMRFFSCLDVPVYWLPGDFESVDAYEYVFSGCQLDNVIDAMRYPLVRLDGYKLSFLPGGCPPSRGYIIDWNRDPGAFEIEGVRYVNADPSVIKVFDPAKTILFGHQQPHIVWNATVGYDMIAISGGKKFFGHHAHEKMKEGAVSIDVLDDRLLLYGALYGGACNMRYYFSADEHGCSYSVDSEGYPRRTILPASVVYASPGSAKHGKYGIITLADRGVGFDLGSVE